MTSLLVLGIVLAIGAAFLESVVDVLRKRQSSEVDAVVAAWSLSAPASLLLGILLAIMMATGTPVLGTSAVIPQTSAFWIALAASLLPNILATYLYMRALKTADLSLVLPLVTLSAPFLLITGFVINGEVPSWLGVFGILITTAGTYLLKYDGTGGWFAPFTRLLRDRASLMMLGVAFLYALSSPWDKRAAMEGGALWYAWALSTALMLAFTPAMFFRNRWSRLWHAPDAMSVIGSMGIVSTLRALCQFTAVQFLFVAYAIGLKRLSVIFGVLWGRVFFNEPQTGQRAVAAAIMVVGSLLILLATTLQ